MHSVSPISLHEMEIIVIQASLPHAVGFGSDVVHLIKKATGTQKMGV